MHLCARPLDYTRASATESHHGIHVCSTYVCAIVALRKGTQVGFEPLFTYQYQIALRALRGALFVFLSKTLLYDFFVQPSICVLLSSCVLLSRDDHPLKPPRCEN